MRADYLCEFYLSSEALLGAKPVGSRVYLWCDHQLLRYTLARSDIAGVTIRGPGSELTHCVPAPRQQSQSSTVGQSPFLLP